VQRRARSLQAMPRATEAHQLAPPSTVGMAIGTAMPPVHPAVLRTGGLRADMAGGSNLAAATSGDDHAGWRGARGLRLRPGLRRTQRALGLARETGKRLGGALGSRRVRGRGYGLATAPKPASEDNQQNEDNTRDERKRQVGLPHQPLHSGGRWADHTASGAKVNEPHDCSTQPAKE
jgi:hypothetical protein